MDRTVQRAGVRWYARLYPRCARADTPRVKVAAFIPLLGLLIVASALPTTSPAPTPARATTIPWQPAPGTSWQWQIVGRVDERFDVQMYDVDLQDAVPTRRTERVRGFGTVTWPKGLNSGLIDRLHERGITVICYLDTGAWESYRPDADLFPRAVLGARSYASNGDPWVGERWLDIRRRSWHRFAPILWARFDLAVAIGCDGVEPDQNNPWGNRPGFPISRDDQRRWYLEVAQQAHARGLSVGMKNGIETIDTSTVAAFDWALNEECFQYDECRRMQPFIDAGKAVFQVEYQGSPHRFCPKALDRSFSTLKKKLKLDAWRVACPLPVP
jgi:hypothetical protein